jgi:hypothetical protein
MRLIEYPRGGIAEVCYLCERVAKDTDDETVSEELWKRLRKGPKP